MKENALPRQVAYVQETPASFSPKKFVLQVQGALRYLLRKWFWILALGLLAGLIGYVYSSGKNRLFEAEITFALDERSNPTQKTALTSLSENLGLQRGPEEGTAFFTSMTNIAELVKSRFLLERTLKDSVSLYGHRLLFIDFFLDSLGWREKWMKQTPYAKTNWLAPNLEQAETDFQNSILRSSCEMLSGTLLKINQKGAGTSIFSIKCVSEHELFSKHFLEGLMNNVSAYYTRIKTERAKANLDFIQRRSDSLQRAFTGALYTRASYADANANPARQVAMVSNEKQLTDVQILRTAYTELSKALDLAKSELIRDTPLFQYLDTPILPLKSTGSSPVMYFVLFSVAGTAFALLFFLAKLVYNRIMEEPIAYPAAVREEVPGVQE